LPAYTSILQQLTPDFYGELQSGLIFNNERFAKLLTEGGQAQFVGKHATLWLDYGFQNLQHNGYGDYMSVSQVGQREGFGFQSRLGKRWTLGLGESWEADSAAGSGSLWSASGSTTHVGAMVARAFGNSDVSGTVSWGWNSMASSRSGELTVPFTATMTRGLGVFGSTARISHSFVQRQRPNEGQSPSGKHGKAQTGWYLNQTIDVGLTDLLAHPATETVVGTLPLALQKYNEAHFWLHPTAETGHLYNLSNGWQLRPYIMLAARPYMNGNNTYARATFIGAPEAARPMAVPIDLGSMIESGGGLKVSIRSATFGAEYGKTFASHYNLDTFNLSLRIPL